MLTSTSSAMATRRRRITSTVTGSIAARCARAVSMMAVNVNFSKCTDLERIARTYERTRSVFDDNRGPAAGGVRAKRITIVNLGRKVTIFLQEEDGPGFKQRRLTVALAACEVGDFRLLGVQRR